jgi:hypothetical protein
MPSVVLPFVERVRVGKLEGMGTGDTMMVWITISVLL